MKKHTLISFLSVVLFSSCALAANSVIGGSSGISPPLFMNYSFWSISPTTERAFPFTVASGGPYYLEEIQVAAFTFQLGDKSASFSIYTDGTGQPGEPIASFELASLTMTQQVLTIPVTEEIILNSGMRYWLAGTAPVLSQCWSLDKTAMGPSAVRTPGESVWTVGPNGNVSAFAILGTPVPEPATLLLLGLGALVLRKRI